MEKKLNPYKLKIISVDYYFNIYGKTSCKIAYINPIGGDRRISLGVAKLKPGEKFDYKTGKRIAESRAKLKMYKDYCSFLEYFVSEAHWKHKNLVEREEKHIKKLIDDLR